MNTRLMKFENDSAVVFTVLRVWEIDILLACHRFFHEERNAGGGSDPGSVFQHNCLVVFSLKF